MEMSLSERRQIENEMIFRRSNEKVVDELDELDAQLIEDDYPELIRTDDIRLHFLCECSDENCVERIPIKTSAYLELHKNRKAFILKHNHQVDEIETVILSGDNYIVVEKNKLTPEPDDNLNTTEVDNS